MLFAQEMCFLLSHLIRAFQRGANGEPRLFLKLPLR